MKSPELFITDFAKFDRPATLHAGFQALSEFKAQEQRFPRPRNADDAAKFVALVARSDLKRAPAVLVLGTGRAPCSAAVV